MSIGNVGSDKEIDEGTQELVLDNSNKVSFPGFPYSFEALHEQILVSIDVFKSGLECKECGGKGRIKYQCNCVREGHAGLRYSSEDIELVRQSIGPEVAAVRREMACPECGGDPSSVSRDEQCVACKGAGALIIIPDSAKQLPCTGVVVSMGKAAKERADYVIGDRVLFGFHSGSMIPTKAGLMFKRMDWYQVWLRIEGADALGAFDFIIHEHE